MVDIHKCINVPLKENKYFYQLMFSKKYIKLFSVLERKQKLLTKNSNFKTMDITFYDINKELK